MMRAVIYCRCSTEEERQIDALRKQVEEARACVYEFGWILVDEFVESKSGTTSKGRREYSRLFQELCSDTFDIIVIKSQDRLMRNTKDWYLFLDRMQSSGKKLYLYLERKFFATEDSLITGIKAILAEEYSRELSRKIVNAHRNRQKKGERAVITNRTFGYDKLPDGRIVVNEEQREACVKLFQYVVRYGCRTTSRLLAEEGICSKTGKIMSPATIRRIVINPMYKGICVMNRQQYDFETKKITKMPKSEWIYAEGIAPPIVTDELWQGANDALKNRTKAGKGNECYLQINKVSKHVFSGKLICGICGRPYYRTVRRRGSQKEERIIEWKCSGYLHAGRMNNKDRNLIIQGCDNVHLNEELVFKVMKRLYQTSDFDKGRMIQQTMEVIEKVLDQNKKESKVSFLKQRMNELKTKKQILLVKLIEGVISDEDYQIQNKKFDEEICKAEKECHVFEYEKQNTISRLHEIRERLQQEGIERACISQMLGHVQKILVLEWQLEIHYDDLTVYADIPFSAGTRKGRYLDRLKIMEILKEEPCTTVKKIAEDMGQSPYMVRNRMLELKKAGYIRYSGAGGNGTWEILQEFGDIRNK